MKKFLTEKGHPEMLAGGALGAVAGAEAAAGAVLACSAGACTAGAMGAAAIALTCPLCAVGGAALLGYGAYRKWKSGKKK